VTPTLIARRGSAQFAFADPTDPESALVFDAPTNTLFPSAPLADILNRGLWQLQDAPGTDTVDTTTDSALEAAQARVAALLTGDPTDPAMSTGEGTDDGQQAFPATEDNLTLAITDEVEFSEAAKDAPVEERGDGGLSDDDENAEMSAGAPEEFTLTILEEGVPTVDGRIFQPNSVTWRDPPVPLMFTTENTGDGHKGAKLGGTISRIFRDGAKIKGAGYFAKTDDGQLLKQLVSPGPEGQPPMLNGISADVGGALSELGVDDDGVAQQSISQGRIMGATCLPFQAFDDMRIAVTSSSEFAVEGVTAALGDDVADPETNVGEDEIQEPIAESNDSMVDAQQSAALGDVAMQLSQLAQLIEEQAQMEQDQSQPDDNGGLSFSADQVITAATVARQADGTFRSGTVSNVKASEVQPGDVIDHPNFPGAKLRVGQVEPSGDGTVRISGTRLSADSAPTGEGDAVVIGQSPTPASGTAPAADRVEKHLDESPIPAVTASTEELSEERLASLELAVIKLTDRILSQKALAFTPRIHVDEESTEEA
jgi:hypothetical protein